MKYVISMLTLLTPLTLSYGIIEFIESSFPPSVLAMLLLLTALKFNLVSLKQCEPSGNVLLKHLPLFFVPAGVGIIEHTTLIEQNLLLIICTVSCATFLTLLMVAKLADALFNNKEIK